MSILDFEENVTFGYIQKTKSKARLRKRTVWPWSSLFASWIIVATAQMAAT